MEHADKVKEKKKTPAKRKTTKGDKRKKPLPREKSYTDKKIIAAIKAAGGILSVAADELGCDRSLIYKRSHENPEIQAAIEEARESILDMAEGVVFTAVSSGDVDTAKWVLARQGRKRGYGEKIEQDLNVNKVPTLELILNTNGPVPGVTQ